MEIAQTFLSTAVRHGLSALGVLLVSHAWISAAQSASLGGYADALVGLLLVFGSAAWSIIRTKVLKQKV